MVVFRTLVGFLLFPTVHGVGSNQLLCQLKRKEGFVLATLKSCVENHMICMNKREGDSKEGD